MDARKKWNRAQKKKPPKRLLFRCHFCPPIAHFGDIFGA
jgi:hypothetical protein